MQYKAQCAGNSSHSFELIIEENQKAQNILMRVLLVCSLVMVVAWHLTLVTHFVKTFKSLTMCPPLSNNYMF